MTKFIIENLDRRDKLFFTARISRLDAQGNFTISFSKPLRPIELLTIEESLEFLIEPADETSAKIKEIEPDANFLKIGSIIELPEENKTLSNRVLVNKTDYLNFTWEPLSLFSQDLDLKIDFKYKLNISTSETARDKLVIIFSEPLRYRAVDTSFL